MVDLIAKTPLEGVLPISSGSVTLTETAPAFITSITPHAGKEKTCATALKTAHDLALPAVGRSSGAAALRILWTGQGQYFLVGAKTASKTLAKSASLTDQSDSWAVMTLEGADAAEVLARVCPIDTRPSAFKRGHTARTELAHMMSVVSCTSGGFEIMVMRSFARTAAHQLMDAMDSIAAQNAIA